MSLAANRKTVPVKPRRQRDPYRYGVRYVRREQPDGTWLNEPSPLPQEALLHPLDEDYPVESDPHYDDCSYLKSVLRDRARRGWLVLSNHRVDCGVLGLKAHGPDISAFKGFRGDTRKWKMLYVAKEKVRPLLNIEITSPSTRKYDIGIKIEHYYRAGVPLYVVVDAQTKQGVRRIQIRGYRRGLTQYEPIAPDAHGRVLLEPFGVLLGTENQRVCCYDAKTGEKIGNYEALVRACKSAAEQTQAAQEQTRAEVQARQSAEQQARAEAQARQAAEDRVRRLEEELRRLRDET